MIIEDVDAFKCWLAKTLEPICDAEPGALAKYIIALVKKDKPEPELKAACLDNLEVFLQSHTRTYVDKLFEALSSRVYLENASRPGSPPSAAGSQQGTAGPEPSAATTVASTLATSTGTAVSGSVLTTQRSLQRTSDDEISDDDRDHRRRQSPGTGSRAHSGDREREDRRRNRTDGRAIGRRGVMGPMQDRYSRHDRRRGNDSRSPLGRARSRSPIRSNHLRDSALASIGRRENLGVSGMQPFSANDTVSPVPVLGNVVPTVPVIHNEWSKNLPTSFNLPPPPFLPKARCRDFDEKGFCLRGEFCSFDHGSDPVVVDDISNMLRFPQGNKSQPPAIGLNIPLAVPVQLPVHQGMTAPSGHGPSAIPSLASGAGLGDTSASNRNLHRPPPSLLANEPYNPEAPAIRGPGQSAGYWNGVQRNNRSITQSPPTAVQPYDPVYATPITRNVITIQRVPDVEPTTEQQPRNRNLPTDVSTNFRQSSRRPGRGNYRGSYPSRFGAARRPYTQETPGNTSLQVKNVPSMYNNIAKLNEHFTKFGNVVSIQIAFDGDPEGALVTFSKNSEANAAYRSSEPMFNNRFIKLFWHRRALANADGSTETKESVTAVSSAFKEAVESHPELRSSSRPASLSKDTLDLRTSLRERMFEMAGLGTTSQSLRQEPKDVANHSEENLSPSSAPQSAPAPAARPPRVFNPAAMRLDNTKDNLNVLMKKKEESNKEFVKKQVELQKQKQALLQKQLDQQKTLISKAQQLPAGPEKDELMKTIRNLDQKIAELKKELSSKPVKVDVLSKPAPTKEQTTKELLDVELELYNRQSSGHDVSDLATKLAELRQRAAGLGIDTSSSGYHRSNAFVRGRGRGRPGGFTRSYSTEKPRKLLIIGFKQEEKDDVITHFNAFGALEDVFFNEAVPSLVVTYLHAAEAAAAASHGSDFNNKRLIMKWHRPSISQEPVNSPPLVRLPSSGGNDKAPNQNSGDSTVTPTGTGEDSLEAAAAGLHDDEVDVDVDEELLLAGDDEDDEDNEKRSWR